MANQLSLASFNIFWFREHDLPRNGRSDEDLALITRVVERLDADAISFQEILDAQALTVVLGNVPGRRYRLVDGAPAGSKRMRVVLAIDEARFDVIETAQLTDDDPARPMQGRRAPQLALLRHKASAAEFWFAGVHFASGDPTGEDTLEVENKRRWDVSLIASWQNGLPDGSPPAIVLGDFNLTADHPRMHELTDGDSPFSHVACRARRGPNEGDAEVSEDEQWSTLRDKVFIDHALVSAGAANWVSGAAVAYAFDLDAVFGVTATGAPLLRQLDPEYELIPWPGQPKQKVMRMYRVTDHRPVRVVLAPG